MVGADREWLHPQIWPPVTNRLDEPDELAFVGRELGVLGCYSSAEEGDRSASLVQDRAKIGPGGVAIHQEADGEVGQLEGRPVVSAALSASNVVVASGDQANASRLRSAVRGATMAP